MADGTNLDFLPAGLRSEIEKSASAQGRNPFDLVTEAVDRYVKDQQWSRMKSNIRQRAHDNGWTEDDVDRAIAESRAEISR
jgi:hypothetical protein